MGRPWTEDLVVGDEIEFVHSDRPISSEYQPGVVFTISQVGSHSARLSKNGLNYGEWYHCFLLNEFKPLKKKPRHLKGVARFFKDKDL